MRIKRLASLCNSLAVILAISAAMPVSAALVTVQESKPLVARTGAWQTWNDRLHIKKGMESRQLVLTFTNGADGRKPMTGIHVQLARKPFAEFKDFSGTTLSRDLRGTVQAGDIPITVQGYGPSGARLVWKLAAETILVSGVTPNPFKPTDKVVVHGMNFSDNAKDVVVTIGGKPAKVISVKNNEIQLTPSTNLTGGKNDLVVAANSMTSAPFKVMLKGAATLNDIDHLATAPQHPVVIAGTGFSKVLSENVVKFGTHIGRVTRASDTRLTVIVPNMVFPTRVDIAVYVRGMKADGNLDLHVDQRVIPKGEFLLRPVETHGPSLPHPRSI
jgi:hypothetical protein